MKKNILVITALTIALLLPQTLHASTSKTVYISGNSQSGTYMTATISNYHETYINKIAGTTAQHSYGYSTTISTSNGGSNSKSSSASVGATVGSNYLPFGMTLNAQLGLTYSETCSWTSTISYTIPASKPTAIYCIAAIYPSYNENFKVIQSSASGNKTLLNKSITHSIKDGAAYVALWNVSQGKKA